MKLPAQNIPLAAAGKKEIEGFSQASLQAKLNQTVMSPTLTEYTVGHIHSAIADWLSEKLSEEVKPQDVFLTQVPEGYKGDLAFRLIKHPRRLQSISMRGLMDQLSQEGDKKLVDSVDRQGIYLNVTLSAAALQTIVNNVIRLGEVYNSNSGGAGRSFMVDYSGPNPGSPMKVFIIRSTIIGEGLSKIAERNGFRVVRVNNIGDWGIPLKLFDSEKTPVEGRYSDLVRKFKNDELQGVTVEDLISALSSARNKYIIELAQLYRRLGISFDVYLCESAFTESFYPMIKRVLAKGIAKEEEAVVLIPMPEKKLGNMRLLRKDSSLTYSARDLAILSMQQESIGADRCIFVAGKGQTIHFEQLFEAGRQMCMPAASHSGFLGVGHVVSNHESHSNKSSIPILEEYMNQVVSEFQQLKLTPPLSQFPLEVLGRSFIFFEQLRIRPRSEWALRREGVQDAMRSGLGKLLKAQYMAKEFCLTAAPTTQDEDKMGSDLGPTVLDRKALLEIALSPHVVHQTIRGLSPNLLFRHALALSDHLLAQGTDKSDSLATKWALSRCYLNVMKTLGIGE